jgi:hypothetical protein
MCRPGWFTRLEILHVACLEIFQWPRHFQLRKGNLERETTFGNIKKIINSYGDFSACRQTGFPSDAGGFGAART